MNDQRRPNHFTRQEDKELLKEAYKELISEYVKEFGWWSIKTLGALCIGALLVFLLSHGWTGN